MSNHVFADIPRARVPRSMFRRNHNLKTTINTDYLYPIYVDEALPGDVFKMNAHLFARLATPTVPIMDNLYLDTFFFAVPVRLVDKEFKRFMGERPFGDVRNDYETPVLTTPTAEWSYEADEEQTKYKGAKVGSLSDYLGIPVHVGGLEFCPWWHRAYNLVWNEWFRDENLVPAVPVAGVHEDGTVTDEKYEDYTLLRRGKRKDYFTGCLPWPQKGVVTSIPFGAVAPVRNASDYDPAYASENIVNPTWYWPSSGGVVSRAGNLGVIAPSASTDSGYTGLSPASSVSGTYHAVGFSLVADLTTGAAVTINQLREAFAIQHLLESDARGGTRYTELIRVHFNVVSPDARQQRPEYLGGSSRPLNVTTVAQTSASEEASTPQGNLAAFVTANNDANWVKTFTEHTVIIGLCNVRADLSYQQGLPRMFSRRTKYDFYWPELANLGEQAVLNKEIYAQGTEKDDDAFGYQERFAEYRYHPNVITGQFRSVYPWTLDYWHLAQKFDNLPLLNQTFIEEHVPIERVLAVTDEESPNLIVDGWFECNCVRPMPLYSVPGLSRL